MKKSQGNYEGSRVDGTVRVSNGIVTVKAPIVDGRFEVEVSEGLHHVDERLS